MVPGRGGIPRQVVASGSNPAWSPDGARIAFKVRVRVDTEGAVRQVDILKSSGSESADQAVKVALYQWWFEPKKDEAGNAIASVVTFPIVWR